MRERRKASFTADAACAARADGARHRDPRLRNPDTLAGDIVGMPFRVLLWPGLRRRFEAGYEKRGPGVYYFHQARTHYFDALWSAALDAYTTQFALLGAGFDTRAYRFKSRLQDRARVFEVDHPLTSAEKRKRLARIGHGRNAHVTYVPVDFDHERMPDRLREAGFDPAQRTFFLWEGVSVYLTAAAVDEVLAFVGSAAKGSSIAFDYMLEESLHSPTDATRKQLDVAAKAGEPYRFGVGEGGVARLVERHGLRLLEDLDAPALEQRFLTGADGKLWGHPAPSLRLAHAAVPV